MLSLALGLLLFRNVALAASPPAISTATVGPTTYTFRGLVAVGSLPATLVDQFGDTFGGVGSAIAFQPFSFVSQNGGSSFAGTLVMQPDRGHNGGGAAPVDYAARSHLVDFVLTPYYDTATAPANTLTLDYRSSAKYFDPTQLSLPGETTGQDPSLVRPAAPFNIFAAGPGAVSNNTHKTEYSFDLEGLAVSSRDLTRWISDEYGPYIYHVAQDGKTLIGSIQPPRAIVPTNAAGGYQFNTLVNGVETAPASGRLPNQGFEGLTISADGKMLYACLQTATVQDGGSEAASGPLTRLLGYDISNPLKTTLVQEYVVQLPASSKGKVYGQSEIHYVKPNVFLVLSRDGKGLGNNGPAATASSSDATSAFKNAGLIDVTNATNIVGKYDAAGQTFVGSTYTPATFTPFVSYILADQLAKFGLHNGLPLTNDIVGKFESLALASCFDSSAPDDYFLFSAADNDFITTQGKQSQPPSTYSDPYGMDVPNTVFVFRVTLPGAQIPKTIYRPFGRS